MGDRRPYRPGDLLRAFDKLRPSEEQKAEIAALLNLPYRAQPPVKDAGLRKREEPEEPRQKPGPDAPGRRAAATQPEPTDALPSRWQEVERAVRRPPPWIGRVEPLAAQPPSRPLPEPERLWVPQWTRSILTATMAAPSDSGEIDWEAVVQAVALSRPLRALPSKPRWSAARGVQLLLDKSTSMMPFAEDRLQLETEIRNLAGPGLEVLSFAGCPGRGAGSGIRLRWKPYHELPPPRTGSTVLVVSDLGIGQAPGPEAPATPEEWLTFAELVRGLSCRLTAVVPYAPARWPQRLLGAIDIVYWSRETTAGAVHRARKMRP